MSRTRSIPLVEEFFHFHRIVYGEWKWKFHRFSSDFPLVEKLWKR